MHRRPIILIAAAVMLALAGCSSNAPTVGANEPLPAASRGTMAAPSTAPAAASTPTPPEQRVAAFGETATFSNGVAVTVTAASSAAGQYASGAVEGRIVTVTIKITNGSKGEISGALMSIPRVSYGTAGTRAVNASDSQNGHGMVMASTILPGETQTAQESFGIPAAEYGNIRVEISGASITDKPAVFKGAVQ